MKPKPWAVGNVSTFFGVSNRTIYEWLRKGLVPGAFKIGSNWYVDPDTLFEHINKVAHKPTKRSRDDSLGENRHGI